MKDDYVLFWFKIQYEDEWERLLVADLEDLRGGPAKEPEFEVSIVRIQHGVAIKGHRHEEYVTLASECEDSLVKGAFESLEEAKLKLTIAGWNLLDATEEFRKPRGNEFRHRSVVKAFRLKR